MLLLLRLSFNESILEILDPPLQVPIIFPQAEHMGEYHVLRLFELFLIRDRANRLLKLARYQVRQVVDAYSVALPKEGNAVPQVLVLHHQLEVGRHCVLVLLRHIEQVLPQLVVTDEHLLNDAD